MQITKEKFHAISGRAIAAFYYVGEDVASVHWIKLSDKKSESLYQKSKLLEEQRVLKQQFKKRHRPKKFISFLDIPGLKGEYFPDTRTIYHKTIKDLFFDIGYDSKKYRFIK